MKQRIEVFQVYMLDLLACPRPKLEIQSNRPICHGVHNGRMPGIHRNVGTETDQGKEDLLGCTEVQAEEFKQYFEASHVNHLALAPQNIAQNIVATCYKEWK